MAMATSARTRHSSLTYPELLIIRETVVEATPARSATSRIVGIVHQIDAVLELLRSWPRRDPDTATMGRQRDRTVAAADRSREHHEWYPYQLHVVPIPHTDILCTSTPPPSSAFSGVGQPCTGLMSEHASRQMQTRPPPRRIT